MKPTDKWRPDRVDWKAERERIDLAAVATRLLGLSPGRRGGGGRKFWWHCPFHEDLNPSFCIDPGKPWWKCWGCGESGDAANLVMRLEGRTFPEALAALTGRQAPSGEAPMRPAEFPTRKPPRVSSGLPEIEALALVQESAARLWADEGSHALSYLVGPRGLAPETIRTARLGYTPGVTIPTRQGDRSYRALGIVIPWFIGERLALIKIRQPDDRRPKYIETYRDPPRLVCYPGPETIRPGRPLVVVEGEFDALSLGEALGELAAVVTLGSASAEPAPAVLGRFLSASPWFIATDADEAGERVLARWPMHSRRVRPPRPHKDWTEAQASGLNSRRWWSDILAGVDDPPLFTWDELAPQRWGPAAGQ